MAIPVSQSEESAVLCPAILLLDDRPENISLIEATLSGLEVNLLEATSGPMALQLLEEHDIAAALVDVTMPGVEGFDVAFQMRSQGNAVPIIFITPLDFSAQAAMTARSAGATDFLHEPLEPNVLRTKVQVFLDLFHLRHAEELRLQTVDELKDTLAAHQAEAVKLASEVALQRAELERQNRELTVRNNQLDSFAHVVSHDLRQPLGSILDYIELIEDSRGEGLDANSLRWIRSCLSLGDEMRVLIERILDFSRLGSRAPLMRQVDTSTVLTSALNNLHAAVKKSGALIKCDVLPTVFGSEQLLTCLFQNLIDNAIKYRGPEPPRIQVRCGRCHDDKKMWCFRVIDNGRGFGEADHERVFEMFGRCDNVGDTPGTGIGLAMCRRIVEAHGGRIWAKSMPRRGAQFLFVLPEAGPGAEAPPKLEK